MRERERGREITGDVEMELAGEREKLRTSRGSGMEQRAQRVLVMQYLAAWLGVGRRAMA